MWFKGNTHKTISLSLKTNVFDVFIMLKQIFLFVSSTALDLSVVPDVNKIVHVSES